MTDKNTFIPSAASAVSSRAGKKAKLARYIDSFDSTFEDNVFQAFAEALDPDGAYIPIQILGYVQDVMDKICWNARKLIISSNLDDEVWGCDPTEKAREDVGVSCEIENVEQLVDDDFKTLYCITSNMMQCVEGMDFDLHYFNPSEVIDDEWVYNRTCGSFSDAQVEMDDIVDKLKQQGSATALADMRARAKLAAA